MTTFEKLIKTLEAKGAKVFPMKKNFGDIYKVEDNGKQVIVKMYKESKDSNILFTKVYIDGKEVYKSSIAPANEGKNIEAISKDLLNFISSIFNINTKDVEEKEEIKVPVSDKEKDVVVALKALDKTIESLEVIKDVLVKLVK